MQWHELLAGWNSAELSRKRFQIQHIQSTDTALPAFGAVCTPYNLDILRLCNGTLCGIKEKLATYHWMVVSALLVCRVMLSQGIRNTEDHGHCIGQPQPSEIHRRLLTHRVCSHDIIVEDQHRYCRGPVIGIEL